MSFVQSSDEEGDGSRMADIEHNEHVSVIDELEAQFRVGNAIGGVEESYLLYAEYGSCLGFGIRKGRQLLFKGTTDIRRKEFYCSCRGFFGNSKEPVTVTRTYSRQHIRTGCPALLRIRRSFGKETWVVAKFVKQHNHELLSPDDTYLLRSVRNLSCHKKTVLDALRSAGIGVAQSFRFMENQSGGVQHVGFTKVDAFNYADSLKQYTRVSNGDACALMKFCTDKSNSEQMFYSNVKLDSEGRLMHIYFRDSRSLTDYEAFGDVLLVDTTYRTNKYDIVVAPFVGVNHHRQNILFGIGFLSSESTSDFNWLFSTFLESMNGRQPQIIFTDQCQAMMAAIDSVFPDVCHRLCHWHISRNAPSHFGSLNQNKDFQRIWRRCMKGVESEEEFEELWTYMIKKYELGDVQWFGNMYNLKKRWASVFTQDKFSCGMIATSRSEATNRSLKQHCATTNCLFEFVQCYERMKTEWRNREAASDVSNIGNPGRCATANPLLRSASRHLTRATYILFEKQMINVLNYDIVSETNIEGCCVIKVKLMHDESDEEQLQDSGEESGVDSEDEKWKEEICERKSDDRQCRNEEHTLFRSRLRTVFYDPTTNVAKCSCKSWETMGIVCRHILKVFNTKPVKQLPDCYLLPRWCKDAKLRLLEASRQNIGETKLDGLDRLAYVNCFMRLARDIVEECQYVPTCRNASLNKMRYLHREMLSMMDKHRCSHVNGERSGVEANTPYSNEIRDPRPSKRRARLAQSKKTSIRCSSSNPKESKKIDTNFKNKDEDSHERLEKGAAVISSQLRSARPGKCPRSSSQMGRFWIPDDRAARIVMGSMDGERRGKRQKLIPTSPAITDKMPAKKEQPSREERRQLGKEAQLKSEENMRKVALMHKYEKDRFKQFVRDEIRKLELKHAIEKVKFEIELLEKSIHFGEDPPVD